MLETNIIRSAKPARRIINAVVLCFLVNSVLLTANSGIASLVAITQEQLSPAQRLAVFDEVWQTINEKYYDPAFNGVDWNEIRTRYRPRVEAVKTDEELYALLQRMTGELRDSHTRVRSPRQREDRKKQQGVSTGVTIREVEGQPVIVRVAPDSAAARTGIMPGMIVQTVDGKPFAERLASARQDVGASSSERAAILFAYSRVFAGEPDTSLKLGLLGTDGKPLEVTWLRQKVAGGPQFTARLLPSGYAYLKFNEFRSAVEKPLKEALAAYKNAPGLVIDLRENGGGDLQVTLRVLGYFLNDKVLVGRATTRTGKPLSLLGGLFKIPLEAYAGERGGQLYGGRLVVLTSERTGSAAETFAAGMQENQRATIIGAQTCGCALIVLEHRGLKGGGELDISEAGGLTAKGKKLEGVGVTPDQFVPLTIADLRESRDAALQVAENHLKELTKP